jgi:TPR repeat protein
MKLPWKRKPSADGPIISQTEIKTLAESGNADAQFTLAMQCNFAPGDERSGIEAAGWFRRAADQGHALAQFNLGVMYSNGEGVNVDESEAGRWFHRAAERGDPGAQFQMGKLCERRGYRVPKTEAADARIEAYKWFNLAAAQGYANSEAYLERSNLRLNHEELDEGKRRVAAFVVKTRAESPP